MAQNALVESTLEQIDGDALMPMHCVEEMTTLRIAMEVKGADKADT